MPGFGLRPDIVRTVAGHCGVSCRPGHFWANPGQETDLLTVRIPVC
jgi:hypothetical protein